MSKEIYLTGDRPTGKLHIGHYIGSLKNRVAMQNSGEYEPFVMIADTQAFTDNARNPEKIRQSLTEVALDYLAVGIDPTKTTIFVQSQIKGLFELTEYFMNLVSVAVSYTHLRAHETDSYLVCRLLLEKKKNNNAERAILLDNNQ